MSIQCTRRVWDHSSQKGSALFLLLAIADYADKNGFAFPGLAALAEKIRMSRRQTMRLVARLEDAGELLVLRREGRGNLYIVRTAASREALAAALDRAVRRGATLPGGTGERTLDDLLGVEPEPAASPPGTRDNLPCPPPFSTGDKIMAPLDKAMSPAGDNPGATGARSRPTGDRAVTATGDTTTSPDPSGSITDPPGTVTDPSAQDLWDRALTYLPLYMDRRTFDYWLRGTRALTLEGDCLVVEAHTARAVEWLEHRLGPHIDRALHTYLPGIQVRFVAPCTAACTDPGPDPTTDPATDPGPDSSTDPATDPATDPGTPIPEPVASHPNPESPNPGSPDPESPISNIQPSNLPPPAPSASSAPRRLPTTSRDNCFSEKTSTQPPLYQPATLQSPNLQRGNRSCPRYPIPHPTHPHSGTASQWHSARPPPTHQPTNPPLV